MKKIIKSGKKIYSTTCSRCGCEFTYENEDINYVGSVTCPECGCVLTHITTPFTPPYPSVTTPWYIGVGDPPFNYNQVTCKGITMSTGSDESNNIKAFNTTAKIDPTIAIQDSTKVEK